MNPDRAYKFYIRAFYLRTLFFRFRHSRDGTG
jgi:hypothetical protein